jgi:hypothetical protein
MSNATYRLRVGGWACRYSDREHSAGRSWVAACNASGDDVREELEAWLIHEPDLSF